jgi:hypothetical protein
MFDFCECCVLSGRGLCDELIACPEESYRMLCVVCDLETSRMRRPWLSLGCSAIGERKKVLMRLNVDLFCDYIRPNERHIFRCLQGCCYACETLHGEWPPPAVTYSTTSF